MSFVPFASTKKNIAVVSPPIISASAARDITPPPRVSRSVTCSGVRDWNWACQQAGVAFVSKTDIENYNRVRAIYDQARQLSNPDRTPEEDALACTKSNWWKDACKTVGVSYCRKGTAEYDLVLAVYKKIADESKEPKPQSLETTF